MAAVAAFILAPEIGIPTMPLQFKVSHQNNHSLPKIPRNSHVCVSQQEGTCLAHLCSSEQRMYFPTTHIPIFVDHASPYQFWQRQAVAQTNKYGVFAAGRLLLLSENKIRAGGWPCNCFFSLSPFSLFYVNRWLRLT